ncbi:hypothetical protein M3Y95_00287000 [Aphelenchoides besseyi]|nr:hypothetical protein M3Y95_00287000 [Aphelenchoides besseyi]
MRRKARKWARASEHQRIILKHDGRFEPNDQFEGRHKRRVETRVVGKRRLRLFGFILSVVVFTGLSSTTSAATVTRLRSGNRGEVLPYDPAIARAQAEAELEEDLRREFVRTSMLEKDEMVYRYPTKSYGPVAKKFQCYSCMSMSYQNNWERLQHLYVQPKIFTDRCEHPSDFEKMPTVECGSVCVSLVEADVEGGVFLGFKYIRGCINRILTHDFNLSALRTHRFTQLDLCRSLPRTVLFNNPRTAPQVFGEVNLCTCFGDRCNAASQSSQTQTQPNVIGLFIGLIFSLWTLHHV